MPKPSCPQCGSKDIQITSTQDGAIALCKACGAKLRVKRKKPPPAAQTQPSLEPKPRDDTVGGPGSPHPITQAAQRAQVPLSPLTVPAVQNAVATVYAGGALDLPAIRQAEKEAPLEWHEGDVILDLYEVKSQLGEGGMGKVWLVHHRGWNVDLAVKAPKPEILGKAGGAEAFKREAETWVSLGLHPHIVSCYYVRDLGDVPRVFAEYVEGGSLHDWINDHRLYEGGPEKALERILDIAIQFAWGLHYAHELGLVNQDVKPANVMMTLEGTAKVTDFGLAGAKGVEGTPAYQSPEQARAAADRRTGMQTVHLAALDRTTDIWSWGLSVLEMFSGELTWMFGGMAHEVLESYLESHPLDEGLPGMPKAVADLLKRCFREEPANRPQSMHDVARTLIEMYQTVVGKPYGREQPNAASDTAESLNNRALSLLDLGNLDQALQMWERALKVHPHHPHATYNRALVLWRKGLISDREVRLSVEQARASHPKDWFTSYMVASVCIESGDYRSALNSLESVSGPDMLREEVSAILGHAKKFQNRTRDLLRSIPIKLDGRLEAMCIHPDDKYALLLFQNRFTAVDVLGERVFQETALRTRKARVLCLSGDGKALVVGGQRLLQLWSVPFSHRKPLQTFDVGSEEIRSVGVALDGKTVVAASDDAVKIWDVASGNCLKRIPCPIGSCLHRTIVSQDGRYVLSDEMGQHLEILDTTEEEWRTVIKDIDPSVTWGFNHDSTLVAVASGYSLKLWDPREGDYVKEVVWSDPVGSVLLFTPDGAHIVCRDLTPKGSFLALHDLNSGRCLRTMDGALGEEHVWCLTHDARYAYAARRRFDGKLMLYGVHPTSAMTKPAVLTLSRVERPSEALKGDDVCERELAAARISIAARDFGAAAARLRVARAQKGRSRDGAAVRMWQSLYSHLPRRGLVGCWENDLFRPDVRKHEYPDPVKSSHSGDRESENSESMSDLLASLDMLQEDLDQEQAPVVAFDHKAKSVLAGAENLRLYDVDTGEMQGIIRTYSRETDLDYLGPIVDVRLSNDGCRALSVKSGGALDYWDLKKKTRIHRLEAKTPHAWPREISDSVAFTADDKYAVFCGGGIVRGRLVCAWDLHSMQMVRRWNLEIANVRRLVLGPYGFLGAGPTADDAARWHLWNVWTGESTVELQGLRGLETVFQFSLNGRFGVSWGQGSKVRVWDATSGRCLSSFEGHRATLIARKMKSDALGTVTDVAITEDGQYVLSAEEEGVMRVWEVRAGRCVRDIATALSGAVRVSLSPDGRLAIATGPQGLRAWSLDWALGKPPPEHWDEQAIPFLRIFLRNHRPYHLNLRQGGGFQGGDIRPEFAWQSPPSWTDEDFQKLLLTLGFAGFGCLDPQVVSDRLKSMALELA